jgi:hypothetical protein
MSLVKKPTMTPRKLAAVRRNARLSRGPATPEGRERIRAAHLVHGFYNDPIALLMQRMEDSNFRQVSRLTSLLMRMKSHERQMEALEQVAENPSGLSFRGVAPCGTTKNLALP